VVTRGSTHSKHGVIAGVETRYRVRLDDKQRWQGLDYSESELEPEPAKLSSEEAWLEVALLVGRRVATVVYEINWKETRDKETRHQAYAILGGNGVDVGRTGTDEHKVVKARLNDLIERAEKRGQA
jgi:hypothetical protein